MFLYCIIDRHTNERMGKKLRLIVNLPLVNITFTINHGVRDTIIGILWITWNITKYANIIKQKSQ